MTYQDLFDLPDGGEFLRRGKKATKVWYEKTEDLLSRGDPKANPPTPDIYFRAYVMFYQVDGLREGITLTTVFPKTEIPAEEEISL